MIHVRVENSDRSIESIFIRSSVHLRFGPIRQLVQKPRNDSFVVGRSHFIKCTYLDSVNIGNQFRTRL